MGGVNNKDKALWFLSIAGILVVVAAIGLLTLYFNSFSGPLSLEHSRWGTFGDFMGGTLNPIVSLIAFFALLYTIKQQSSELRNSTEQLAKSAEALETQNQHWEKQSFENKFFHLLDVYQRILQDLESQQSEVTGGPLLEQTEGRSIKGRECVRHLVFVLKNGLLNESAKAVSDGLDVNKRLEIVRVTYENFYKKNGHIVGHYFRSIYHIVKFVNKSSLPHKEKLFYTKLLRAQLSKYELILLFYNCLTPYGKNLTPLVKDYNFLKNLEPDAITNTDIVLLNAFLRPDRQHYN